MCEVLVSFLLPLNFVCNYIFVVVIDHVFCGFHIWTPTYDLDEKPLILKINPPCFILFWYVLVMTKMFVREWLACISTKG